MDRGDATGEEEGFGIHQAGDGQPAFHSGGTRYRKPLTATLKIAHP